MIFFNRVGNGNKYLKIRIRNEGNPFGPGLVNLLPPSAALYTTPGNPPLSLSETAVLLPADSPPNAPDQTTQSNPLQLPVPLPPSARQAHNQSPNELDVDPYRLPHPQPVPLTGQEAKRNTLYSSETFGLTPLPPLSVPRDRPTTILPPPLLTSESDALLLSPNVSLQTGRSYPERSSIQIPRRSRSSLSALSIVSKFSPSSAHWAAILSVMTSISDRRGFSTKTPPRSRSVNVSPG